MTIAINYSTKVAITIAFSFSLLLQSCVRKEIVKPEFLLIDTKKDITVYTTDKREIRFNGGDYKVLDKEHKQYLAGKGKQYNPTTNYYNIIFTGEIAFDEVEYIEWRERTTIGIVGDVVFIGSVSLIFLFFLFLSVFQPSFH